MACTRVPDRDFLDLARWGKSGPPFPTN